MVNGFKTSLPWYFVIKDEIPSGFVTVYIRIWKFCLNETVLTTEKYESPRVELRYPLPGGTGKGSVS